MNSSQTKRLQSRNDSRLFAIEIFIFLWLLPFNSFPLEKMQELLRFVVDKCQPKLFPCIIDDAHYFAPDQMRKLELPVKLLPPLPEEILSIDTYYDRTALIVQSGKLYEIEKNTLSLIKLDFAVAQACYGMDILYILSEEGELYVRTGARYVPAYERRTYIPVPALVQFDQKIVFIAAGGDHLAFLTQSNEFYIRGNGTCSLTRVRFNSEPVKIASGGYYTLVLCASNEVYTVSPSCTVRTMTSMKIEVSSLHLNRCYYNSVSAIVSRNGELFLNDDREGFRKIETPLFVTSAYLKNFFVYYACKDGRMFLHGSPPVEVNFNLNLIEL